MDINLRIEILEAKIKSLNHLSDELGALKNSGVSGYTDSEFRVNALNIISHITLIESELEILKKYNSVNNMKDREKNGQKPEEKI